MYGGTKSFFSRIGNTSMTRNQNTRTIETQTNPLDPLDLLNYLILSQNLNINEESRNVHALVLNYLNNFHHLLNEKIASYQLEKGKYNAFIIPNIPNYSIIYDMIYSSTETSLNQHQESANKNLRGIKNEEMFETTSPKVQLAKNVSSSHEIEEKCKTTKQYAFLQGNEKLKAIINSPDAPKDFQKNISNYDSNDEESGSPDECIILSKYHDEGKNLRLNEKIKKVT